MYYVIYVEAIHPQPTGLKRRNSQYRLVYLGVGAPESITECLVVAPVSGRAVEDTGGSPGIKEHPIFCVLNFPVVGRPVSAPA